MINRREEIITEVELRTFRKLNLGNRVKSKVNTTTEEPLRQIEDIVSGSIQAEIWGWPL